MDQQTLMLTCVRAGSGSKRGRPKKDVEKEVEPAEVDKDEAEVDDKVDGKDDTEDSKPESDKTDSTDHVPKVK